MFSLLGLWAAVATAADFRIAMCPHSLDVEIEASEPLFNDERSFRYESCGSGVPISFYADDGEGEEIARLSVASNDGRRARIVLEDLRHGIRLAGTVPALDRPTVLETPKAARKLRANVVVRTAPPPTIPTVSIDVENRPVNEIVMRLRTVSGWKVQGLGSVGGPRVTFRFDSIPVSSLLQLVADVHGFDVTSDRAGSAVFRPRKTR